MIRPQMKKAKETKKYIEALKVNDKILTIGGIYGTISKMNEDGTIIIAVEDGFMQVFQEKRDKFIAPLLFYRDLYEKNTV